ncbi:hypothetical protein C8N43_3647 [Litoreibacter ponti]|uniref:DUF3726 domain-containing protein n=1 Tax=Litoreibacter ponti TaxID=1510457 RepID=A0A2T6BFJ3_9RHOB|nr:hypothetical protein [Litoreibacter ponti]PTX54826.1 hypothetical protein C8N43_3647 [Litoreibacter ponti]
MSGPDWLSDFLSAGPDYPAERRAMAEMQALLLKAGIGGGLPLGHAQDMAALAPLLMSDPQLLAMATAALEGPHHAVRTEGTAQHLVIEQARIAMAGPVLVDALICGADRVVLHDLDWPMLLWPVLAHAQKVFGAYFQIDKPGKHTLMITPSETDRMEPFGPAQPVPLIPLERLTALAAKTYVPATEASRLSGAGAGLRDND